MLGRGGRKSGYTVMLKSQVVTPLGQALDDEGNTQSSRPGMNPPGPSQQEEHLRLASIERMERWDVSENPKH